MLERAFALSGCPLIFLRLWPERTRILPNVCLSPIGSHVGCSWAARERLQCRATGKQDGAESNNGITTWTRTVSTRWAWDHVHGNGSESCGPLPESFAFGFRLASRRAKCKCPKPQQARESVVSLAQGAFSCENLGKAASCGLQTTSQALNLRHLKHSGPGV